MKKESQYDAEIGELKASIEGLREKLSILQQKRAEETCEFRVGDKMVDKEGQTGEVVSIRDDWGEGIAIIRLYKKDGTPGKRTARAYSWYGWQQVKGE